MPGTIVNQHHKDSSIYTYDELTHRPVCFHLWDVMRLDAFRYDISDRCLVLCSQCGVLSYTMRKRSG